MYPGQVNIVEFPPALVASGSMANLAPGMKISIESSSISASTSITQFSGVVRLLFYW